MIRHHCILKREDSNVGDKPKWSNICEMVSFSRRQASPGWFGGVWVGCCPKQFSPACGACHIVISFLSLEGFLYILCSESVRKSTLHSELQGQLCLCSEWTTDCTTGEDRKSVPCSRCMYHMILVCMHQAMSYHRGVATPWGL